MKRAIVKLVLNVIIFSVFGFFGFFAIFYYFTPKAVAISLSITFTLLLALAVVGVGIYKHDKRKLAEKKQKNIFELLDELCFTAKPELINLFYNAYKTLNKRVEKYSWGLKLIDERKSIFLVYNFDGLKKSDVLKAFNKLNEGETAHIFSYDCDGDVKEFACRFNGKVVLENKTTVYELLSSANCLPKITHILANPTMVKRVNWKVFLDRKKAVRFLALGFMFLAFSFFVPIKVYYIVCGSLLCVFSLAVLTFVKPQTPT